jgi:hypothetical protein
VRCLTCHYDLRKLAKHRCPECGRRFDPNDPSTFDVASKKDWMWLWLILLIVIPIYAVVGFVIYIFSRFWIENGFND